MVWGSVALADTPDAIQLKVVFDVNQAPIDGRHDVVVRLFASGSMVHKALLEDVRFDHGV
tara:strand:- start:37 stop:216 length:180 start_codon:yes stop_codon:yes gene_type:complete